MLKKNLSGRAAYLEAMRRTAWFFESIDDLLWLRRGIAAMYKHYPDGELFDARVQEIASEILICETDSTEGRDVPYFRETVYNQTEWYLLHPEIHVPFLTRFLLFRILEDERVPLTREVE